MSKSARSLPVILACRRVALMLGGYGDGDRDDSSSSSMMMLRGLEMST